MTPLSGDPITRLRSGVFFVETPDFTPSAFSIENEKRSPVVPSFFEPGRFHLSLKIAVCRRIYTLPE
jgi:hypothetical protein